MTLEEARRYADRVARTVGEAISVIPYGDTYTIETKVNAIANGLRRIYDTDNYALWNTE